MPNKSRYGKEVSRKFIQLARDFRFNKTILIVELFSTLTIPSTPLDHIFLIKKMISIYISAISSGDSAKELSSHCSTNPKKAEVANDDK